MGVVPAWQGSRAVCSPAMRISGWGSSLENVAILGEELLTVCKLTMTPLGWRFLLGGVAGQGKGLKVVCRLAILHCG